MEQMGKKLLVKFTGKSIPTADELVDMIKGVQNIIPKESRKDLRIEKIEPGSVDIFAFFEPIVELFENTNYETFFEVIGKIGDLVGFATIVGAPLRYWIKRNKNKIKLSANDVKELLSIINNDPNLIRIIAHSDFKDLKKLSTIVRKKGKVIVKGEDVQQYVHITQESAELIEKIADVDMDDSSIIEDEEMTLHLKIARVSFYGKERWRTEILEERTKRLRYITIEDPTLLLLISQNKLLFSGKEVIEAVVRIENVNGKLNYALIEYQGITTIENLSFE